MAREERAGGIGGFLASRVREGVVALAAAFLFGLVASRFPALDTTQVALAGFVACVVVLTVWELGRAGFLGTVTLPIYQRPDWRFGPKGRLKRDTEKLVKRLRHHIKTGPSPIAEIIRHERDNVKVRNSGDPEVWERWERQKAELDELFAADLKDVLRRYQERGLLDEREASHIEWDCEDMTGLARAATKLELLARKL